MYFKYSARSLAIKIQKQKYQMKRFLFTATIFLIICISNASSQQQKWTLEDCINYAVSNNIGLQRQRLETQTAEINLFKSKMDVLPTLNLGSDVQLGYGRSVDPTSNLITFSQNLLNSFYAGSNLRVFNGFVKLNTISANKFMLKAGIEDEKVIRNTLIIDIMGQYYQVLYSRGLESASKMQLELSEAQLFRIVKMVETGKEALSKQFEMESRVSTDKLSFTIALNTASQALTTLKQMLQLEPGTEFDILIPDLEQVIVTERNYNPDSVYLVAAQVLPRLQAIEYELRASKKQVAAAYGNISPNITVGGSMSTGYFNALNDTSSKVDYQQQLKNNVGQQVYVSLNIPIFNNYNTGRNIRLAKIRRDDTALRLEQEKNSLYTEVENICLNFNRGKDEFAAAEANLKFNRRSFNAVEKKFESGLVDVTDYSAAQTTLFTAETEALRTRLQFLIRKLTIQFYSTGEYQNLTINQNL